MKSKTCKSSGNQYLEEYHSQAAAEISAEELKELYNRHFTPYQCRLCGYWHLSQSDARKQCHLCLDSNLFHKDIYTTSHEAENVAVWLKKEKHITLYPYRCPHGSGWHLTKRDHRKKAR